MELDQLLTLKVERIETVFVKPLQPTPTHILSFSTLDDEPNLEFLSQTIYVFKSKDDGSRLSSTHHQNDNVFGYQSNDPSYLIQKALSGVLVYYYPLAGKLYRQEDKKLRINCTGEGVPFLVAETNCSLASLNYFERINDLEITRKFVFQLKTEAKDESYHPLMVQVTKFTCGGFTLGMGISHSVFDGFGAGQFVRAITELASGKNEISVKPVWERERLVITTEEPIELPIDERALATSPYLPTTVLALESFNVYSESIKRLKMGLMKESVGEDLTESFTTLEALSAYIWRSRFRAFELNPDGKTVLSFTVGIRKLLVPPLPEGYYGNAFVGAFVDMVGKELNEIPLSKVARMIKESKKNACKTEYIWSWLRLLEKTNQNGRKFEGNGATMVLTDWRQLGLLEQVDFGWGKSVNMIPVPWKIFGYIDLCIFMPPCSLDPDMKGGVRVSVCLPRAAMAKFKEEMDALNKLEDVV